jgi:hypothetical protein
MPIPSGGISYSPVSFDTSHRLEGDDAALEGPALDSPARDIGAAGNAGVGIGAMVGKLVSAGQGAVSAECRANAKLAGGFFQKAARVLKDFAGTAASAGKVALSVLAFPLTIPIAALALADRYQSGRIALRHDEQFRIANKTVVTSLERVNQGSLAADPAIMNRVVAHAKGQNSPLTPESIKAYVAAGEKIANGLIAKDASFVASVSTAGSPVYMKVDGQEIAVRSSVYTTRALSWYLMAKAATQDVAQEALGQEVPSNMVTSGSFVLKDPKNTFFEFLSAAPTAADRISTHFADRAGHTRRHALMGANPIQRGIEDYSNGLPGQRATMLFDKLRASNGDAELFIKFELAGCPPVFQTESDVGVNRSTGDNIVQFFSAIHRNLVHAVSFLRGQTQIDAHTVLRQEHVVKGLLKHTVADPFLAVIKLANRNGLFDDAADAALSPKQAAVSAKQLGLPFVHGELGRIIAKADARGMPEIAELAQDVKARIKREEDRLGIVSDQYGIQRRGAEVHLSWGG